MNFNKILSTLLVLAVVVLAAANDNPDSNTRSGIDQWVNSPAAGFAPNGDRTSHYPPYYHPTH